MLRTTKHIRIDHMLCTLIVFIAGGFAKIVALSDVPAAAAEPRESEVSNDVFLLQTAFAFNEHTDETAATNEHSGKSMTQANHSVAVLSSRKQNGTTPPSKKEHSNASVPTLKTPAILVKHASTKVTKKVARKNASRNIDVLFGKKKKTQPQHKTQKSTTHKTEDLGLHSAMQNLGRRSMILAEDGRSAVQSALTRGSGDQGTIGPLVAALCLGLVLLLAWTLFSGAGYLADCDGQGQAGSLKRMGGKPSANYPVAPWSGQPQKLEGKAIAPWSGVGMPLSTSGEALVRASQSMRNVPSQNKIGSGVFGRAGRSSPQLAAQSNGGTQRDITPAASMDAAALQQPPPTAYDLEGRPPPAICPSLVLPRTEARFSVSVAKLMLVRNSEPMHGGSLNLEINGTSGRTLLQASLTLTPDGRQQLSLASAGCEEDPRAIVIGGEANSPHGVFEILGRGGELYGMLQPVDAMGSYTLVTNGQPAMRIETGPQGDLCMVASTIHGLPLGTATRRRCGPGPSSGNGEDTWRLQVKPGCDAVLIASCMLAIILRKK